MSRPLLCVSVAAALLGSGRAAAADPAVPTPLPPADRRMMAYAAPAQAAPPLPPPAPAAAPPAAQKPAPAPPPPQPGRLPEVALPGEPPKPSPAVEAKYGRVVQQVVDSDKTLDLAVHRTRLLVFKSPTVRVHLTDDTIADLETISATEVAVIGKKVGTTTLTIWVTDPDDLGKEPGKRRQIVLSYFVRVLPDPETRRRADLTYDALATEVNKAFPDSAIRLQLVGDKLVVRGFARDVYDAYQILRVVRANSPQTPADATDPSAAPADGQ